MADRLFRRTGLFTRLLPAALIFFFIGNQMAYRIRTYGIMGEEYTGLDIIMICIDAGLLIWGLYEFANFVFPSKFGFAAKDIKTYGIDKYDLDNDMLEAKRVGMVYVGRKYIMYTGRHTEVIPLNRLVYIQQGRFSHYFIINLTFKIFSLTVFMRFVDDYGRHHGMKVKDSEAEAKILNLVHAADPAIMTPEDRERSSASRSFNKMRELVEYRRKEQAKLDTDLNYTSGAKEKKFKIGLVDSDRDLDV